MPPTPTPIPLNQLNQTVERITNSIDIATQQGAIGVLLLFALVAVILSLWLLLRTYVNRNKKDDTVVLSQILTSQQRQIEAGEKERRENQARIEKQAIDNEQRYIQFGTGFSEALKYWADQIKAQGMINGQMVETLEALSIREGNQDTKINAIHSSIENVRQALTVLGARIDKLIPEHAVALDTATVEMRTVAASVNATLELLNKKRGDTKPVPAVSIEKDQFDSTPDGKPPAQ